MSASPENRTYPLYRKSHPPLCKNYSPPVGADSTLFRHQILLHELLVERDAQARSVRDFHPPVDRLHLLDRQLVPQRRILDAVLEHERVTTRAEPVDARGYGERARVTVVAEPR